MDFGEMFRILRRRWFVALPALLLTLIATAGIYKAWPNTYQSEMQLTLLDSRSVASAQGNAGNPYLDFTASLDAVVDLLGRDLSSDHSINQLQSLGVTDKFTAGIAANAQGPFLEIIVKGRNPVVIEKSMPIIVSFAKQQLAALQVASSAPPSSLIQLVPISPASVPTRVLKTKVELTAGVAILGIVCSFLLSFIVDSMLSQRDGRRRRYSEPRPEAAPDPAFRARPSDPSPARSGHGSRDWPESPSRPARR